MLSDAFGGGSNITYFIYLQKTDKFLEPSGHFAKKARILALQLLHAPPREGMSRIMASFVQGNGGLRKEAYFLLRNKRRSHHGG